MDRQLFGMTLHETIMQRAEGGRSMPAYDEENTVGADAEEPLEPPHKNGSLSLRILPLAPLALLQLLEGVATLGNGMVKIN